MLNGYAVLLTLLGLESEVVEVEKVVKFTGDALARVSDAGVRRVVGVAIVKVGVLQGKRATVKPAIQVEELIFLPYGGVSRQDVEDQLLGDRLLPVSVEHVQLSQRRRRVFLAQQLPRVQQEVLPQDIGTHVANRYAQLIRLVSPVANIGIASTGGVHRQLFSTLLQGLRTPPVIHIGLAQLGCAFAVPSGDP